MHVGLCIFATDYSIRPDELARAAEERGFESLFLTEHTHIPAGRRTPFPGGGELPREYSHTLDPFVALIAARGAIRSALGRALPLRDRRRLERRANVAQWPTSQDEIQAGHGAGVRHEGDLDQGR